MSNFGEVIARLKSEGRWANFQICVSVGVAALLTYFTIHFCYVHSHLAILLVPTCAAITSALVLGFALITGLLRTDDSRFYYLTYFPILAGLASGILLGSILLCVSNFLQWTQPNWFLITSAICSGPLITFVLSIVCETTTRTLIRLFEAVAGFQTYKLTRNMLAYGDLSATMFYAFPTFLLWATVIGIAVGGLALL